MLPIRPLGTTELTASGLGFGAGHIGSPDMADAEAGRLLNEALDLGITLIDTARGYGLSEERIGQYVSHRRAEFTLVSKGGYAVEGCEDWTPAAITKGVDDALRRLATERIDVMLFHSCPRDVMFREGLIEALERAQREGKVGSIGYSGENEDLDAAIASGRFEVIETSVNVFDQRGLSGPIPAAAGRGMGVIGKRPLGNAPWRYAERPVGNYAETYWTRMQAMNLDLEGMAWGEFAVRFAAYQPGVGTVIVGTGNLHNLRQNVEWVDLGPLPDHLVEAAKRAFAAHDQGWVGQI
jgi:aryl-alcohol dehydrogenase-like predicted oxidoreductase